MILTSAELKRLLHYDPRSGVFTWRVKPRGNVKAGSRAGTMRGNGYRRIGLSGVSRLRSGRFRARIRINGKKFSIGAFDTAEEAACAYESKARELHGEFFREAS